MDSRWKLKPHAKGLSTRTTRISTPVYIGIQSNCQNATVAVKSYTGQYKPHFTSAQYYVVNIFKSSIVAIR